MLLAFVLQETNEKCCTCEFEYTWHKPIALIDPDNLPKACVTVLRKEEEEDRNGASSACADECSQHSKVIRTVIEDEFKFTRVSLFESINVEATNQVKQCQQVKRDDPKVEFDGPDVSKIKPMPWTYVLRL